MYAQLYTNKDSHYQGEFYMDQTRAQNGTMRFIYKLSKLSTVDLFAQDKGRVKGVSRVSHKIRASAHTEKTIFPFPFTLNGISSWGQFSIRF